MRMWLLNGVLPEGSGEAPALGFAQILLWGVSSRNNRENFKLS